MRALLIGAIALIPTVSEASDVSVIVGGWSHHFVPAAERDALNQNQGTVGIELSTTRWTLQVSRMTDSFGCNAKEIAAARRWELFAPRTWLRGGLMLGAIAADRCSDFPTPLTKEVWVGEINPGNPSETLSGGLTQRCHAWVNQYWQICDLYQKQVVGQVQHARWYGGVLPGAFLEVGDRLQAQLSLVRSPWTGHHLVLYGQLSIRVFSF